MSGNHLNPTSKKSRGALILAIGALVFWELRLNSK